jgi:uncharacterized OB-fold protein
VYDSSDTTTRSEPAGSRPPRPRPSTNADNEWFWEGCREHELRVQTFADGSTFYPPIVRNPATGEVQRAGSDNEPQWQVASGRGTLYSFAVVHHPQAPAFDYPLVVGLVELEPTPGSALPVRLVANVVDCSRDAVHIGMPLELCWLETHAPSEDDPGVTIPQFRPAPVPTTTETVTA